MGLPALRHEHPQRTRGTHLKVVGAQPRRKGGKSRPNQQAAAFQAYVFFVTAIVIVALAGAGRVWLSVQAAEASVESARLAKEIKIARYRGDMLEIRQSALEAPSRVQAIAGTALGMAPVEQVGYLDLTQAAAANTKTEVSDKRAGAGIKAMLASAMNLAAGEAQVMLVGDVGLASAK